MDIEANEITINVSSKTNDITLSDINSQITVVSSGRGLKGDKGDTGGINYDHSLMDKLDYASAGHTGFEPSLPETPTDPELKFLNGNKQFAPIAIGSGGFAANLYYTTIPSDVAGYYKLSYTAEASETILSGVVCNNEVLFRTYLFDDPIDTSVIDGGVWGSVPWLYVSSAAGITRVKIELFVRHTDTTETTLFSGYTEEINSLVRTRFKSEITQSSFTVDPTDRLGARVYGTTTSNSNITIYSVIGDGDASYFNTPLRIRHNQLRDLNGDPEYQHMTSAEKIVLDNTSGTNTGDNATNSQYSGLVDSKLNVDQTTPQTTVGTFTFTEVVNTHETIKTASGFRRAMRIGPQNLIANDGAYLEFATSTVDGTGPQICGVRNIVGVGAGDLLFKTGTVAGSQTERMRIWYTGNISIGTSSPNPNAILDVASTTKAFMPPRMTTAQRDAIPSPIAGMVIYNSTTNVLNFHNGTAWGAV